MNSSDFMCLHEICSLLSDVECERYPVLGMTPEQYITKIINESAQGRRQADPSAARHHTTLEVNQQ
ncbi:hypothetical protein METP3_01255 [Methanosarcinales archaeon]|nr:hypothetical protein METP3_01255 [Methanosarcinales archaeon]